MTDRERIYNLVNKVCDYSIKAIDKITDLKQENSELKKRVAELEKPKKKRKFRAMTNSEFCRTYAGEKDFDCGNCSLFYYIGDCELADNWNSISEKPYKNRDGKYILIEVRE